MSIRVYDRIEQFDENSREFPVQLLMQGRKPRSYTWRCLKHLDQGAEGACVGFGAGHELIARPVELMHINNAYARKIYQMAKKIDGIPGEAYEGTSVLAGLKVLKNLGWIDGYYWAFGINDLINGIGTSGPAILGLQWYSGMENTNKNGLLTVSGRPVGGHCILCKSVNFKRKVFVLHNSWGSKWGKGGDCFISFADMQRLLIENGEAAFVTGRHKATSKHK